MSLEVVVHLVDIIKHYLEFIADMSTCYDNLIKTESLEKYFFDLKLKFKIIIDFNSWTNFFLNFNSWTDFFITSYDNNVP